jgi:hypothetical protein
MLGNIDSATKPDAVEATHVLEQLDQSATTSGSADKTIMESDREQFRRPFAALAVKKVKCIPHVLKEVIARRKPAVFVEAVIVRFIGVGDNKSFGPASPSFMKPPPINLTVRYSRKLWSNSTMARQILAPWKCCGPRNLGIKNRLPRRIASRILLAIS